MSYPARKILNGILSTNVSGAALILTSVYSLNALRFHWHRNFGHFGYGMASVGLCMIIADAINAIVYGTKYPIESLFPLENEKPPEEVNFLFYVVDILASDAVPCLTCAIYTHHRVPYGGLLQLVVIKFAKEIHWFFENLLRPKCRFWKIPFVDLYLSANMIVFGLKTDNFYSIAAAAPYQIVSLLNAPCTFYTRSKLRVLRNYVMIPYVITVTRGLCTPLCRGATIFSKNLTMTILSKLFSQ